MKKPAYEADIPINVHVWEDGAFESRPVKDVSVFHGTFSIDIKVTLHNLKGEEEEE